MGPRDQKPPNGGAKPRKPQDAELAAIGSIMRTLAGLDATTRSRVMHYITNRVGHTDAIPPAPKAEAQGQ